MFYYLYGAGVFFRRDRITIQEKEKEEAKKREMEMEAKKIAEERRSHTLKVPTLKYHKKYFWKRLIHFTEIKLDQNKSLFKKKKKNYRKSSKILEGTEFFMYMYQYFTPELLISTFLDYQR